MYSVVHNMETTIMQAIQIEAFGNPAEVLKVVDIPDVGAPGEGEVVIALEASPINMSDLLMISGRYGYRPKLPSVMGTEGVGRVVAVGSGVKHLKQGDRTLVPYPAPAWAERIKVDAGRLRPLPGGDVNQPAMHFIFRDISMRGFWLANWFNSATPDQITRMYDRLTPLVASGAISAPIAGTYRFSQVAEAVAVASKNRGKVLFKVG